MSELRLPSLGADMDAATLVRWCVAPGAVVQKGDVLGEIETDKGVFDLDAREGGVVVALLVAEGSKVRVGTPIVTLRDAGGVGAVAGARRETPRETPLETPRDTPRAAPSGAPTEPPSARRVHASPLARRVAAELGVELATVTGTGLDGAITRADVERAAAGPVPTAPSAADGMRRAIAAAVTRAKREIPHYYLAHDLDLHDALDWLARHNATRPVTQRVLPGALLLRATAQALARFPDFNGTVTDGRYTAAPVVDLAVITALRGGGLVAPVIPDAASLSVDALNAALLDLVVRARSASLRTSELGGGTASVTMLGERGVHTVYGVIHPPQVAIVGFGTVGERAWAHEGMLAVRPMVTVTLAADHRVSDGVRGAQFLTALGESLLPPEAP